MYLHVYQCDVENRIWDLYVYGAKMLHVIESNNQKK